MKAKQIMIVAMIALVPSLGHSAEKLCVSTKVHAKRNGTDRSCNNSECS